MSHALRLPRDGEEGGGLGHLAALVQHHHGEPQAGHAGERAGRAGDAHHADLAQGWESRQLLGKQEAAGGSSTEGGKPWDQSPQPHVHLPLSPREMGTTGTRPKHSLLAEKRLTRTLTRKLSCARILNIWGHTHVFSSR